MFELHRQNECICACLCKDRTGLCVLEANRSVSMHRNTRTLFMCVRGTYGRIVLFVLGVYVSSSAAGGDAINAHRASWGLPVPEPQARRSGRRGGTGPCSDSHVAGLLLPGLGPWQGWPGRDGTESLWLHQPSSPAGQWNRQPP